MTAFYIAVFIAILGVITIIPTDIGRKVVRETSALIARPTSTPLPSSGQATPTITVSPSPNASASPTLQIKPIIRHDDERSGDE